MMFVKKNFCRMDANDQSFKKQPNFTKYRAECIVLIDYKNKKKHDNVKHYKERFKLTW